MNRYLTLAIIGVSIAISACSSTEGTYPKLDNDSATYSIVVANFARGRYLQQFDECQSSDAICLDPPPFEIDTEVVEHVYGDKLPDKFKFASTGHFGLQDWQYFFESGEARLILIKTDGSRYVLPRYEVESVAKDVNGDWVVPLFSKSEVCWLLEEEPRIAEEVYFDAKTLSIPISEAEDYDISKNSGYFIRHDGHFQPKYGMKLSKIRAALSESKKVVKSFSCESPSA